MRLSFFVAICFLFVAAVTACAGAVGGWFNALLGFAGSFFLVIGILNYKTSEKTLILLLLFGTREESPLELAKEIKITPEIRKAYAELVDRGLVKRSLKGEWLTEEGKSALLRLEV